jgi:hypothetical protein
MIARIARFRKEEKPTHGGLDRMRDGDVGKLKHKVIRSASGVELPTP